MKIVKYELVTASQSGRLNELVNEYISKGWAPYGNLTAAFYPGNSGGYIAYGQAMVKYSE
jgi:hypothetical protein